MHLHVQQRVTSNPKSKLLSLSVKAWLAFSAQSNSIRENDSHVGEAAGGVEGGDEEALVQGKGAKCGLWFHKTWYTKIIKLNG